MFPTNYWVNTFLYWPANYWPDTPQSGPPANGLASAVVTTRPPAVAMTTRQAGASVAARLADATIEVRA